MGWTAGSQAGQLSVRVPYLSLFMVFVTVTSSPERILIAVNVTLGHTPECSRLTFIGFLATATGYMTDALLGTTPFNPMSEP